MTRLVLHVERCRGLVEQHDRCVLEQGARNGDSLPLATREPGSVLADFGRVSVRQARHELIAVSC